MKRVYERRVGLTRRKAISNRRMAEDQQPFRCVECGTAVSHINPGPCKCDQSATKPHEQNR